jgi:hypothetical protein
MCEQRCGVGLPAELATTEPGSGSIFIILGSWESNRRPLKKN